MRDYERNNLYAGLLLLLRSCTRCTLILPHPLLPLLQNFIDVPQWLHLAKLKLNHSDSLHWLLVLHPHLQRNIIICFHVGCWFVAIVDRYWRLELTYCFDFAATALLYYRKMALVCCRRSSLSEEKLERDLLSTLFVAQGILGHFCNHHPLDGGLRCTPSALILVLPHLLTCKLLLLLRGIATNTSKYFHQILILLPLRSCSIAR